MHNSYKPFIAIFAGVIVLLLAIWFVLLFFQKQSFAITDDPARLIPSDPLLVITLKDPLKSISDLKRTVFWHEFASLKQTGPIEEISAHIDSVIENSGQIVDLVDESSLYMSLHDTRKDSKAVLFNFRPKRRLASSNIITILKNELDFDISNQYEFLDAEIIEGRFPESKNLFFTFYKGSLLISKDSRLVETSITQYNSGTNILSDKAFAKMYESLGEGNKIFFNIRNLCDNINELVNINKQDFFMCNNFGSWLAWNLYLHDHLLVLNGFLLADSEQKVLSADKAREHTFLSVIPATSFFTLSKTTVKQHMEAPLVGLTGYSLFLSDLHKQKISSMLVISLDDNLFATEAVGRYDVEKLNINDYFVDENNMSLYKNSSSKFQEDFSEYGLTGDYKYLICKSNFIIALPDMDALKGWYSFYRNNQTLPSHSYAKNFFDYSPAFSNFFIYTHIPDLISLMAGSFSAEVKDFFSVNNDILERFDRAAIQLASHEENIYQAHAILSHNPDALNIPVKKWEVMLDDTIHNRLFKVFSHVDNSKEIIVADKSNNIYLISNSGEVLWKRKLPEKIMSDIYQIDYYKNDRYQYLFNTPCHIFLIDRLGRDVASYPVKVAGTASAPLAVFDYDNNKNYRLLIPTESKKILNYDKTGEPVAGWVFDKTKNIVEKPVQHINLDGKDFLFVTDKTGASEILNRRGQIRIKTPRELKLSQNNPVYYEGNDKPYFIITGKNGHLIEITIEGAISKFAINDFSDDHFFIHHDLTGDGKKDYLFLDKKELSVYDYLSRQLFFYKFENNIEQRPFIINLKEKGLFIGVADNYSERIFLFSASGKNIMPMVIKGDVPYVVIKADQAGIVELVKGLGSVVRSYEISI